MIKSLWLKARKFDLELAVRGQIASIMKAVNFDATRLSVNQRNEIKNLVAILEISNKLA